MTLKTKQMTILPFPGAFMKAMCILFSCMLSGVQSLTAQGQQAQAAPQLVAISHDPVFGTQPQRITNQTIKVGQIILNLVNGDALPISIDGRPVGFFYRGSGTMEYTSKEPSERPTMTFNLSRGGSTRIEEPPMATVIKDGILEVTIWTLKHPSVPMSGVSSASYSSLEFDSKIHNEYIFGKAANFILQELAEHSLNDSTAPFFAASIRGKKDFWFYQIDHGFSSVERLDLVKNGFSRISEQGLGRDLRDPIVPRFTLNEVDLCLEIENNLKGKLIARETLIPSQDGLLALKLQLYSEDLFRTIQTGIYRLASVKDENGQNLAFDHHSADLLVMLKEPTKANRPIRLIFEIENPYIEEHPLSQYWEFGIEPWFPQVDMNGQTYTVHATMKVPEKYTPLMAGTTLQRVCKDGKNSLEIRIDQPVRFFTMHAGAYNITEKKEGDLLIRVASSKTMGGQESRLANITLQIIKGYETFLGPFPFREFNVIQRPEWGHGQAPPGLMMITSEAFNSLGNSLNQAYSKGINQRVAHEIAHQYWGIVVKETSDEEQWISEAFSEYCSAMIVLRTKGLGQTAFDALVSEWYREGKDASAKSSIALANRLRDPSMNIKSGLARQSLIYSKGAFVLHALRQEIGDRAFSVFLKGVQDNFKWNFLCTNDLIEILKAITQKDYRNFFEKYFWGVEMPAFKP